MSSESILDRKKEIINKVSEVDRKFIEMTVDAVIEYIDGIDEDPDKCGCNGRVCPSMIAQECGHMPFVNEARIRQVLDIMYTEGLLKREIPEGTGIPHYFKSPQN